MHSHTYNDQEDTESTWFLLTGKVGKTIIFIKMFLKWLVYHLCCRTQRAKHKLFMMCNSLMEYKIVFFSSLVVQVLFFFVVVVSSTLSNTLYPFTIMTDTTILKIVLYKLWLRGYTYPTYLLLPSSVIIVPYGECTVELHGLPSKSQDCSQFLQKFREILASKPALGLTL